MNGLRQEHYQLWTLLRGAATNSIHLACHEAWVGRPVYWCVHTRNMQYNVRYLEQTHRRVNYHTHDSTKTALLHDIVFIFEANADPALMSTSIYTMNLASISFSIEVNIIHIPNKLIHLEVRFIWKVRAIK